MLKRANTVRPYGVLRRLPLTREVARRRRDGGRENSARVVEDADPYKLTAKSAQNPCLPREGGVGVADGGSVKGQTPPVSHPLDSPLGEGAKKDCAYAPQNPAPSRGYRTCLAPWGEVAREA